MIGKGATVFKLCRKSNLESPMMKQQQKKKSLIPRMKLEKIKGRQSQEGAGNIKSQQIIINR